MTRSELKGRVSSLHDTRRHVPQQVPTVHYDASRFIEWDWDDDDERDTFDFDRLPLKIHSRPEEKGKARRDLMASGRSRTPARCDNGERSCDNADEGSHIPH